MIPVKEAGAVEAVALRDAASRAAAREALPEEPVVRIRPARTLPAPGLREVWAHRELLYFLAWRDLKVRYSQTLLGASWVVLQPLLMTVVFNVFLGRLVRVPTGGVPYPLFAYAGLLLWTFFSNAVLAASHSLVASAHVITRVYFPRLIVPAAAVAVRLVDFLVASLVLFALMAYYGVRPSAGALWLPVVAAQTTALALGVGTLFAALGARYRDAATLLPVLLQLWMFASPILYPSDIVPGRWRLAFALNPLTGIVETFRAALFGTPFDRAAVAVSVVATLLLLVVSLLTFRRMEDEFADVI